VLVGLDQWVKVWAVGALADGSIPVIPGLFYLTYLENTGAAFGIFQGRAFVLGLVSIVVLIGVVVVLFNSKVCSRVLIWGLALIIAGGVGNLIDRMARGFVIDYLNFSALGGFPVFNLADCFVVVGTAMVVYYLLFLDGKKPAGNQPQEPQEETEIGENN